MSYPILFGIISGQGGVPGAPTIGTATAAGTTSATISFIAPTDNGGSTITSYTAVSTPGNITGTLNQSSSGTITVNGLALGTSYTFKVYATNSNGNSPLSGSSNQITTASIPVTNGLVFWLDASDPLSYSGSGSTWTDLSGNGRNFSRYLNPTFVSNGSVSYFTGFDSGSWRASSSILPLGSSARTIVAFVRTPTSFSGYQHAFHYGNQQQGQSFGIAYNSGWQTHTWSSSYGGGASSTDTNTMISAGVQDAGTQWIWVNTTAYSGSGSTSVNTGSGFDAQIGSRIDSALSETWGNGRVYLIAAYNRLLSTAEITTIYNTYKTRFSLP